MITIRELLEDPTYRQFLQTKPKLPKGSTDPELMKSPPWVVYVQKQSGGGWAKKEFWKYSEAFNFLKQMLRAGIHDGTINNRRNDTLPPSRWVRIKGKFVRGSDGVLRQATREVVWKPKIPADEEFHTWCKFCRRPTVFKYFRRHKAFIGTPMEDFMDPTIPRCCICGASSRIATLPGKVRVA